MAGKHENETPLTEGTLALGDFSLEPTSATGAVNGHVIVVYFGKPSTRSEWIAVKQDGTSVPISQESYVVLYTPGNSMGMTTMYVSQMSPVEVEHEVRTLLTEAGERWCEGAGPGQAAYTIHLMDPEADLRKTVCISAQAVSVWDGGWKSFLHPKGLALRRFDKLLGFDEALKII